MTRRALVRKVYDVWHVCHIEHGFLVGDCANFPTHAAALAHAIQAVGLATPPEHREAP